MRKSSEKESRFLKLCKDVSLRRLEDFYIYNKVNDELYELDKTAWEFLKKCNGAKKVTINKKDADFIDYCINECILQDLTEPCTAKEPLRAYSSELTPSLRYLELIVTDKCNLACKHCYINKPADGVDLPIETIAKICNEFESIGGMRLIVSGGEPLLHKDFKLINELIYGFDFRTILLTNGTMINKSIISELNFNEVQISIDGLENTHDLIRGKDTFKKTVKSIQLLLEKGIDVSVATMILKPNVMELEKLGEFINKMGVIRWEVDVPCALNDSSIFLDYEGAGEHFKHGFSSTGLYNSSADYACGAHLMAVMNTGMVSKCSFFAQQPIGDISGGLVNNFMNLKKMKLGELECNCDFLEECRGGCRYRAYLNGGINKKDKAKCSFYLQNRSIAK